jgi:hypothetical protein
MSSCGWFLRYTAEPLSPSVRQRRDGVDGLQE